MTDRELAESVRIWRGSVSQREAAEQLGISLRTLQGIEQGRGFRYPRLLLLALKATPPSDPEARS